MKELCIKIEIDENRLVKIAKSQKVFLFNIIFDFVEDGADSIINNTFYMSIFHIWYFHVSAFVQIILLH